MSIVNSWNEWDPLEEVIVGVHDNACIPGYEPGLNHENDADDTLNYFPGLKSKESIQKATSQLDNFIRILKDYQVTIKRPDIIDWSKGVETPDFKVPYQFNSANPRDCLITFGNSIYESTMSWRSRFFEYRAYKTILKDYFRNDPHFKWVVPPKPTMSDSLYDLEYPQYDQIKKRLECIKSFRYQTTEYEPIFDLADVCRLGKDIVIQHSFTTNLMGIEWIKRSLGPEFRVHTVHSPKSVTPWHIDTFFVPIKPPTNERKGLILSNPEMPMIESEKEAFLPSWDILAGPEANHKESTPLSTCGRWLSLNCLMINPYTIIVEESETNTINFMESLGLKVIHCAFRNCYEFGGSFHCHTCDIRRRGNKQSYLPHLD